MKINDKRHNMVYFKNLEIGQIFYYKSQFYIVTNFHKDKYYCAVNLKTGMYGIFEGDECIYPCNGELNIY